MVELAFAFGFLVALLMSLARWMWIQTTGSNYQLPNPVPPKVEENAGAPVQLDSRFGPQFDPYGNPIPQPVAIFAQGSYVTLLDKCAIPDPSILWITSSRPNRTMLQMTLSFPTKICSSHPLLFSVSVSWIKSGVSFSFSSVPHAKLTVYS